MSELTNQKGRGVVRLQLLTTVSACAIIGMTITSSALANDGADRPTVWIELGGQLERIEGTQEKFAPDFTSQFSTDGFLPLGEVQRMPRYGNGLEGSVTLSPENSVWSFIASVRYGRSNTERMSHDQVATPPVLQRIISIPAFNVYVTSTAQALGRRFADATYRTDENHMILDFQAGRDVGLGILRGSATINAGVRFAQFNSKSRVNLTANSSGQVPYKYITQLYGNPALIKLPYLASESWNHYQAEITAERSFRGIGPSLSFDASVPLVGDQDSVRVNFDVGGLVRYFLGGRKPMSFTKPWRTDLSSLIPTILSR